jgi:lipopolysaccharide transport system permease protein
MTDKQTTSYEFVIKPNKNWFHIDWQGLFLYRDLLFILVKRDFVTRYKQTVLGPLWFVLQTLITTIIFTIFFNGVAKIPTDDVPPILFYICGLSLWEYFSRCVNGASSSLLSNAYLFEKVYFPRLIAPLSLIISNIFTFIIQLLTFLGLYFYFKFCTAASVYIKPNLFIVVVPLLLLQTALFALGIGLWMSALTAKYRDFTFLMTFLIQLWMYATPVIYPVSVIPEHWRFILAINPVAAIMDLYRYAFFGTAYLSFKYWLISIGSTFFVLFSGILVFNKVERTFVDTI